MITLRPAAERGHANHGWLDTWHSFSFANYYDPAHMGVSVLRVINDDTVAPGAGFGAHGHRDMEIISYVLSGGLEHKDSMGHGSVIRPGEVQRMSAGRGVVHSEFNASDSETVNFLQIWIMPNVAGVDPGYEQKQFHDRLHGRLCLIASPDGRDDSVTIHQDALLYAARLTDGEDVHYSVAADRVVYLHLARGNLTLNEIKMTHGDGATILDESDLVMHASGEAELLLFDLPLSRNN
ncbi:MAG: pirin family protein [Gammaproteobacteria bacterium]|nr:pirin family protein [Gammaproteobacteria bacterium]